MEGNLLLALKDIKEMLERFEQRVMTMYDYPTDPVVRFLEYGLSMHPRDVKRAAWLASLYKGTIHSLYVLEEFAEPVVSNEQIMYYKQYIKINTISYYIEEAKLVDYSKINRPSYFLVQTGSDPPDPMSSPTAVYYPQNTATYTLDIQIAHMYSKTDPIRFIDYFIEYTMHMLIVNRIRIQIEKYIMVLSYIEATIDIIQTIWRVKLYSFHRLIRNYY